MHKRNLPDGGAGQWITQPLGGVQWTRRAIFSSRILTHPALWSCPRDAPQPACQITVPVTGVNSPAGLAVDQAGNLFISDIDASRVVELPAGCTGPSCQTAVPVSGLNDPEGMAVDGTGDLFIADNLNHRVVRLQMRSVNFGAANVCSAGQTTPSPCSNILTLNYTVTASGTLGTPQVFTQGAPNLDFRLASGNTCTGAVTAGSTCAVNVTFAPQFAGPRSGAVQIVDGSGNVLASTLVYGTGGGPAGCLYQPWPLEQCCHQPTNSGAFVYSYG